MAVQRLQLLLTDIISQVWDACRWSDENHGAPNHEIDCLKGHEDVVNYVQFR
jgi:hypothetical protein